MHFQYRHAGIRREVAISFPFCVIIACDLVVQDCHSRPEKLHLQTYNNVLHVYGMHISRETVLSAAPGSLHEAVELRRVNIYLQQSHMLRNNGSSASTFVGDGRSLLFAFSDGSLQLYSWQAKVDFLQN